MIDGSIVGWSHSQFGKLPEHDLESLIVGVVKGALADANLEASDVDEIFVGNFNAGLTRQDFPASLVLQADDALRFLPVTRVENACATGSAAIDQGLSAIGASRAKIVLVVGAEKMTDLSAAQVGDILLRACYTNSERVERGGFAGIFGTIAEEYFARYGDQRVALAKIAAKNHRFGVDNPFAQFRKDLGVEFCSNVSAANPLVAGPLRRTDCSPIADGAAAIVLAADEVLPRFAKAVGFRAFEHVNDFLPMTRRDPVDFEGGRIAWQRALKRAGVALDDLSFLETHDCFTIAELIEYEMIGLTPAGEGARAIEEGWTERGGRLPVNLSGGLKSKGHPIGATGISMHVMAAMQLTGSAGAMQLPGAILGAIYNMGGTAVANYASVLEARR
jgi:acetyl-CoA C-acetyltransferase